MARKRRGRGEGSIHERPDGLWEGKISLGYDGNGKRRRHTVYGKTKKEVQEKLRKLQNSVADGVPPDAEKLSVAQYLPRWLEMIRPTVAPNTFGPYESHVRLYITPQLGGLQLSKVTPFHVQQFYAQLEAKGVSATMRKKVGTTLTTALAYAVLPLRIIAFNPAVGVKKARVQQPEIQVFAPDQVGRFLKEAREDRLYPFYVFMLDAGTRPGEAFALRWPDLDLDAGRVSILRSLEEVGGRLRVKELKTKQSRRSIRLSPHATAVLREHRRQAEDEGLLDAPVFCDTEGGYLRNGNVTKRSFQPLLSRTGLPSAGLYSLRHTCATLLLLANVPAKVVSERLGHSTVKLTLDTYSHVLPDMQRDAAEALGRILFALPKSSDGNGRN
jgi:integrase